VTVAAVRQRIVAEVGFEYISLEGDGAPSIDLGERPSPDADLVGGFRRP